MQPKLRFHVAYFILAAFAVLAIRQVWLESREVAVIPYSQFQELLESGQIESIEIGSDELQGSLREPLDGRSRFATQRVDPAFVEQLERHDAEYRQLEESTFLISLASWLMPALFFVAIWMFFIRRMSAGGPATGLMSIGRSKAKVYVESDTRVTFDDVAGVDEAKEELAEIVAFLKDPAAHSRLGARLPRGILLVGPPGTGKTLLARAVAGQAGVPFFSISGSEFVEMFVGVGAARVRDLFEQARAHAPCIVFIDELDALGRARQAGPFGGTHDEKEQTLNQLLVELDGFDSQSGIVLLAATNRPEILDPALLRAGRFDRQVLVDRPDKIGRTAILRVHVRNIQLTDDLDLEQVAALTPGFTGADLANLVNEAALVATRRHAEAVSLDDFTRAIERIVAGLEKRSRILNLEERRIVAYHEMGHALVAHALPKANRVHKVSIIPRGIGALGYTISRPTEDRYLMTRDELEQKIAVLLGGRAAEQLVFEHLSTGAADDLAKATEIARSMVTRYAMHEELGHVSYETDDDPFLGIGGHARTFSDATAREIDQAVRDVTNRAYQVAREQLVTQRRALDAGADALLARETLDADDLEGICAPANADTPTTTGPLDDSRASPSP